MKDAMEAKAVLALWRHKILNGCKARPGEREGKRRKKRESRHEYAQPDLLSSFLSSSRPVFMPQSQILSLPCSLKMESDTVLVA